MNNYHIYDEIGSSRYTHVYKGREKNSINYVGIKSIDKQQKDFVLNQVSVMYNIHHHNIIKFYNWYETSKHIWLILEYCAGMNLYEIVQHDKSIPEQSILLFIYDIVNGLYYMHSKSFIICHYQLSSCLSDENGIVKLSDFSYTKTLQQINQKQVHELFNDIDADTNELPSYYYYLAPEIITQNGIYSYSSDIWTIGIIMYELATGTRPFNGNDIQSLTHSITTQSHSYVSTCTPVYNHLLDRILQKDVKLRIQWHELITHPFFSTLEAIPLCKLPVQELYDTIYSNCSSVLSSVDSTQPHITQTSRNTSRRPSTSLVTQKSIINQSRRNSQSAITINNTKLSPNKSSVNTTATTNKQLISDKPAPRVAFADTTNTRNNLLPPQHKQLLSTTMHMSIDELPADTLVDCTDQLIDDAARMSISDLPATHTPPNIQHVSHDIDQHDTTSTIINHAHHPSTIPSLPVTHVDLHSPITTQPSTQRTARTKSRFKTLKDKYNNIKPRVVSRTTSMTSPVKPVIHQVHSANHHQTNNNHNNINNRKSIPRSKTLDKIDQNSMDTPHSTQSIRSTTIINTKYTYDVQLLSSILFNESADCNIKPLVGNHKIDKPLTGKLMPTQLTVEPLSAIDILQLEQNTLELFLTHIYQCIINNSNQYTLQQRSHTLLYLHQILQNSDIANLVINSSLLKLFLRIVQINESAALTTYSLHCVGLLLRHATLISDELAALNVSVNETKSQTILNILTDCINISNKYHPQIKRKAIAALGELLFYITAQHCAHNTTWVVSGALIKQLVQFCTSDDDVVKHCTVKCIDNMLCHIIQTNTTSIHWFNNQQMINQLITVYVNDKNVSIRCCAGSSIISLIRLDNTLLNTVYDKTGCNMLIHELMNDNYRLQQISINIINLCLLNNVIQLSHLYNDIEFTHGLIALLAMRDTRNINHQTSIDCTTRRTSGRRSTANSIYKQHLRNKALLCVTIMLSSGLLQSNSNIIDIIRLIQQLCQQNLLTVLEYITDDSSNQQINVCVQQLTHTLCNTIDWVMNEINQLHDQSVVLNSSEQLYMNQIISCSNVIMYILSNSICRTKVLQQSSVFLTQLTHQVDKLYQMNTIDIQYQQHVLQLLDCVKHYGILLCDQPLNTAVSLLYSVKQLIDYTNNTDIQFTCLTTFTDVITIITSQFHTFNTNQHDLSLPQSEFNQLIHNWLCQSFSRTLSYEQPLPQYSLKFVSYLVQYNHSFIQCFISYNNGILNELIQHYTIDNVNNSVYLCQVICDILHYCDINIINHKINDILYHAISILQYSSTNNLDAYYTSNIDIITQLLSSQLITRSNLQLLDCILPLLRNLSSSSHTINTNDIIDIELLQLKSLQCIKQISIRLTTQQH